MYNDPSYQEDAKAFYRSREDYLETIRLLELGVLDVSMTNLDRKKRSQQPQDHWNHDHCRLPIQCTGQ